ncbi:type II toxin-antitoxin system PemK/MazF family toxin [Sporichthya polymorpha]|uniref:type II toxin-antitoxin system PemK/MazF family toxin n=1 Tax=Sporichthya polymorpha TaxID=35751 RepID=UPI00036BDE5F|nr:type II toxin-antitoxin system PemK/MazF family toxin [Sporichthya polymorpha]
MRALVWVHLDKVRPAVVLTRETVLPRMANITVAPVISTIRGLSTEVLVGPENGLDHECVISCDNITTVPTSAVQGRIGYLMADQEDRLADAINLAFDVYPSSGVR